MKIFIILWFLVGFLTAIGFVIIDMRGEEFDEDYFFNTSNLGLLFSLTCFGFLSPIIIFISCIVSSSYVVKILYKIANIGIDTEEINNIEESEEE